MNDFINSLPAKYIPLAASLWLLITQLGRLWTAVQMHGDGLYSAITTRGGLLGIWNALIRGTAKPVLLQKETVVTKETSTTTLEAQVPGTILPSEPPQTTPIKPAGTGDLTR